MEERPELVGVIHTGVGEDQGALGGQVEVGGGQIAVGVVDGFPLVFQVLTLIVGGDALLFVRQGDGIDLSRAGQLLLADLAVQGGKEKSEIDAGKPQADDQQHIAQQKRTIGFKAGEADRGTDSQNQGKQHGSLPLLPAAEYIEHRKIAEFPSAEIHFNCHRGPPCEMVFGWKWVRNRRILYSVVSIQS